MISSSSPCVVLHVTTEGSYLWCPKSMSGITIAENDLMLGEWYSVDTENKTLDPCEPLFQTRIREGFVEVLATVAFFKDIKFQDVVGYAPGFGRVGSFVKNCFKKDVFYVVWIRYFDMCHNLAVQDFLEIFDVKWLVPNDNYTPLNVHKMITPLADSPYQTLNGFFRFIRGVVVSRTRDSGEIYNNDRCVIFNMVNEQTDFKVGQFVYYIPLLNFSQVWTAVNAFNAGPLRGFDVIRGGDSAPLQLIVDHWRINDDKYLIDVPDISPNILSKFVYVEAFAKRKLVIEYDHSFKTFVAVGTVLETAIQPCEEPSKSVVAKDLVKSTMNTMPRIDPANTIDNSKHNGSSFNQMDNRITLLAASTKMLSLDTPNRVGLWHKFDDKPILHQFSPLRQIQIKKESIATYARRKVLGTIKFFYPIFLPLALIYLLKTKRVVKFITEMLL